MPVFPQDHALSMTSFRVSLRARQWQSSGFVLLQHWDSFSGSFACSPPRTSTGPFTPLPTAAVSRGQPHHITLSSQARQLLQNPSGMPWSPRHGGLPCSTGPQSLTRACWFFATSSCMFSWQPSHRLFAEASALWENPSLSP